MSDKVNNYAEETKPLFRLLRTEAFRFIVARYDHYSLVTKLKADLSEQFPDRPVLTVDATRIDYRTLVDRYYELGSGFYFIENFEAVLENPEIYSGLNQRRDKLAKYPIALFGLISTTPDEQFARRVMEKMPDLWSFRSLLLDLKMAAPDHTTEEIRSKGLISKQDIKSTGTLGGSSIPEKKKELKRLLKRAASATSRDDSFLRTVYAQIARLYEDLFLYDKAIEYHQKIEKICQESDDKAGLAETYNNIGIIYRKKGEWDRALEYYLKSEKFRIEVGNKAGLAASYNNIGLIYSIKGEWDKALEYYLKSEKICIEIGYNEGLATSYNNIGLIYSNKGEWDKALEYYFKSEKVSIEIGDKATLATTYSNIGGIYGNKGEWDKALEYYLKSEKISIEVGDKAGLATTWFNLGTVLQQKGDHTRGDQFIILAGFIAINLGMKYDLQQMAWALEPLLKKLGEKQFMETGERLYAERVLQKK
jgi:tetratricopeptide (TPR) repeat protein